VKLSVTVKPNSKVESVVQSEDGGLIVKVRVPPVDGKANERVIELLAEHFKKPKSLIKLLHGSSGKKKIFEIS
jgi:uncharacterized protein (TIGR00251 family)